MIFDIPRKELDEILEHTPEVWEELRDQRIFITGGTGFFGRWLLASLMQANATLNTNIRAVVMTRNPAGFLARFPEANVPELEFFKGDLRYTHLPTGTFSHILHMATDSKFDDPNEHIGLMDGIITGTRRLLDFAATSAQTSKVLYVSSGAVYGSLPQGQFLTPESFEGAPSPDSPRSLIANAKRMAEQMCSLYQQQYDLDIKIARCFSFVGPHLPMDSYFAMGNFIRDAVEKESIDILGDGTPVRSYMYAGDLTAWLWTLLIRGRSNTPYNVGSDQYLSLREAAEEVTKTVAPEKPVHVAKQPQKTPNLSRYVPDISRAQEELGLEVWTSLEESIKRTARWYRDIGERTRPATSEAEPESKTFVMDIDGVIASITPDNDYRLAEPRQHIVDKINRLYDAGHHIVLFTARGYVTGIDWREVTAAQMDRWGVKYHELHLGKPAATYYVDDRMVPLELFTHIDE